MRGRNNNNSSNNSSNNGGGNRKSPNPLQRSYESNGPDVKVRGTAQHVAEKYLQLARDAQSSSDPVAAENYFQHAEHYYRILLAAQEQMSQQFGHSFPPNRAFGEDADYNEDEGEDEGQPFQPGAQQPDGRNQHVNGGGHQGNGAVRQDGEQPDGQRFDRQNRNFQDRPNQDRNNNNDRNNNDRNGNRRFDRNERGEPRRFERPEGGQNAQGGYQPRPDAPRSDIPVGGGEQPDIIAAPAQPERRPERMERPERGPRPERRPRRDIEPDSVEDDVATALPSFVTTPVRVPVIADEASPPPAETSSGDVDAGSTDLPAKRPRGRRRSPREVMDALGSDGDNVTE